MRGIPPTSSPPPAGTLQGYYLLPLLRNGPNNQIAHLREAMATAWALNRTLILTGIFEHYAELSKTHPSVRGHNIMFQMGMVFDR